ncbi:hypothetical protein CERSUDRAFT_100190 [Gelatoporia subvermispora B]|uniref:JmjC domain-containing protein n=1 Tax=Ceriporiopsis subvermispora (strain B) TaxID=914234 RepID=M2R0E8_CERS8|nr:hypothetical protein CERSUDRAFT_100190 [Gelatoporia subvermispora B]
MQSDPLCALSSSLVSARLRARCEVHFTRIGHKVGANRCADRTRVTERDVELEFWRLVRSQTETVEIGYGADVHSTTHGSEIPTLEMHPLDPYACDPWNLNNIPILQDSLLGYTKSDILGMTVPWTYVGMVFSTFCWRNEDRYTYSIHYSECLPAQGRDEDVVPGPHAAKFEAAIRTEAPDLFEAQPDLLFQLVALISPQRLHEAGDVYAKQSARGIVCRHTKAHHAGLNPGLNFNEAAKFALPNCRSASIARRVAVHPDGHLDQRQPEGNGRVRYVSSPESHWRDVTSEIVEEVDRLEDQYQRSYCKAFCYLSQITCSFTSKVACPSHGAMLCKCSSGRVLLKRFSDAELEDIQARCMARQVDELAARRERPPAAAQPARTPRRGRPHQLPAARDAHAPQASRKRSRKARSYSATDGDDGLERSERTLTDVYTLLKEEVKKHITRAEKEYNIPAVTNLKRTLDFAMDLETRCESVLKNRYVHLDDADVFETVVQWRVYAREHLTMFSLPYFDQFGSVTTNGTPSAPASLPAPLPRAGPGTPHTPPPIHPAHLIALIRLSLMAYLIHAQFYRSLSPLTGMAIMGTIAIIIAITKAVHTVLSLPRLLHHMTTFTLIFIAAAQCSSASSLDNQSVGGVTLQLLQHLSALVVILSIRNRSASNLCVHLLLLHHKRVGSANFRKMEFQLSPSLAIMLAHGPVHVRFASRIHRINILVLFQPHPPTAGIIKQTAQ